MSEWTSERDKKKKRENTWQSLVVLASREGDIDIEAKASSWTYLLRTTSTGKEGPIVIAMDGDVQHTRVVIENVLGSIPMMDVLWNGVKQQQD